MSVDCISDLGVVKLQTFNFVFKLLSRKQIAYAQQAKYIRLESIIAMATDHWHSELFCLQTELIVVFVHRRCFVEVSLKCLILSSVISCVTQMEGNIIVIGFYDFRYNAHLSNKCIALIFP